MILNEDQGLLVGTAPVGERGKTFFCTYRVTDSGALRTLSVTHGLRLVVPETVAGGNGLSIEAPDGSVGPLRLGFSPGQAREHTLPFRISGGVRPYTSNIDGCPDWVTFYPDQRILAGTAPVGERGKTFFCTFRVTDSGTVNPQSATHGLRLVVPETVAGGNDLSIEAPDGSVGPLRLGFPPGQAREYKLPFRISGGVRPHTLSIDGCPDWVTFYPDQRILAGARPADDPGQPFFCTFRVTDSGTVNPQIATHGLLLAIEAADRPLSLTAEPAINYPGNRVTLMMQRRVRVQFAEATGGVAPYTYDVECALPAGLRFSPVSRVLSGTPLATYRGPDCTYRVIDSAYPPASVSRDFELIVDPFDSGKWRFRTRRLAPSEHPVERDTGVEQPFVILPHAVAGSDTPTYELADILQSPLKFDATKRELAYVHPGTDPLLDTPTTYRYLVYEDDETADADDALCVSVSFHDKFPTQEPDDLLDTVAVWIRDDAYWDGAEFRCPDTPPLSGSSDAAAPSNPVHSALAPVHARHAAGVAHSAVRDRVRRWSPGAPRTLSAIAPAVGAGSLSGLSAGFDYTGSSQSVSAGAELGAGSWQAGVVASVTRTDLRYRAAAGLRERGYLTGEHGTDIVSVHPFAAWHAPSGGHVWASLGAGTGELRHRDDLGFASWSHSDVRLRTHAAGASMPLTDILSGALQAEAGMESFAFEIEGGGRISSGLPTLRGRDCRIGLAWQAPVAGTPSLSVAYKRLTGDGPEGSQLETRGSVSFEAFDPRLTVTGTLDGSFGLGDFRHDSWSLAGGIRFAPGEAKRGLGLELDARLVSPDEEGSPRIGIRGEAGYGLWGGPFFGTIRPHVGVIRYARDGALRRTLGVDLRDTPNSRVKLELYDRPRDRLRAFRFALRHRF